MTQPDKMLVTKDGIRVSPEDAEKFGLETEGEVKLRSTSDRPRTTTALGRAGVKNDKTGRVITSAAERGADDGGTPYGENVGLGEVTVVHTEIPTDTAAADRDATPTAPAYEANPSAGAPANTAAADKDKGDGGTSASDTGKRSGDADGNGDDQPKGRPRRAAGH